MFRLGFCAVIFLVSLTVSLANHYHDHWPNTGDPRDGRCTAAGGHCHQEGDSCRKYGEADIGPCCKNGRCCKCIFDSHYCSNAGGHCHHDKPCDAYGEDDIGPCCSHGRCCKKRLY